VVLSHRLLGTLFFPISDPIWTIYRNVNVAMPTRFVDRQKTIILSKCAKDLAECMTFHYRKLLNKFIDTIITLEPDESSIQRAIDRAINVGKSRWGRKLLVETMDNFRDKINYRFAFAYDCAKWLSDLEKSNGALYMSTHFAEYGLDRSNSRPLHTSVQAQPRVASTSVLDLPTLPPPVCQHSHGIESPMRNREPPVMVAVNLPSGPVNPPLFRRANPSDGLTLQTG